MNIVITGGTGYIGSSLIPLLLREGHRTTVLTRYPEMYPLAPEVARVRWDGITQGDWSVQVQNADAVINLAGESIGGGRWTLSRKQRLVSSRINATRALLEAIRNGEKKPSIFVSSSAVGYYGPVDSGEVTEDHAPGRGFLADLCLRWEQEASAVGELGPRVVILRTGVVVGEKGGALARMILPFRLYAGGPIGSGRQWFPWVHREDVAGVIAFSLAQKTLAGPVNVVAPESVDMKAFCAALGAALSRPSWLPVPAFALRAALGEMAGMILTGQRVVPARLMSLGYQFKYPSLAPALASALSPGL
ncbi:MAG TPA: TIGR01777 family oxidoreductase [Bacteroidota bacterium]|nr:TIGR01777 family oxidoreductase [Bacteroidota bacterium]